MLKSIPKILWSKYRHEISNEIHRRPYYELISPLRISLFSLHTENYSKNYEYLKQLCEYLSIPIPINTNLT